MKNKTITIYGIELDVCYYEGSDNRLSSGNPHDFESAEILSVEHQGIDIYDLLSDEVKQIIIEKL